MTERHGDERTTVAETVVDTTAVVYVVGASLALGVAIGGAISGQTALDSPGWYLAVCVLLWPIAVAWMRARYLS